MQRASPVDPRLGRLGQAVIGGVHARKQRVSAARGQLAGDQDRAGGGDLIIAVIGMLRAADIFLLVGFLAYFGDLRVLRDRGKKPVDDDGREGLGKGDVLFRGDVLIAEKQDSVFAQGAVEHFRDGRVERA